MTIEIVDSRMAAILRQKTEAQRLQIAWGMWKSARQMLGELLRVQRPDWSTPEIEREVARRLSSASRQ
jgi:hypothetical protein